jgi:hypothetical protein
LKGCAVKDTGLADVILFVEVFLIDEGLLASSRIALLQVAT